MFSHGMSQQHGSKKTQKLLSCVYFVYGSSIGTILASLDESPQAFSTNTQPEPHNCSASLVNTHICYFNKSRSVDISSVNISVFSPTSSRSNTWALPTNCADPVLPTRKQTFLKRSTPSDANSASWPSATIRVCARVTSRCDTMTCTATAAKSRRKSALLRLVFDQTNKQTCEKAISAAHACCHQVATHTCCRLTLHVLSALHSWASRRVNQGIIVCAAPEP